VERVYEGAGIGFGESSKEHDLCMLSLTLAIHRLHICGAQIIEDAGPPLKGAEVGGRVQGMSQTVII
jgi:hypothetical protein